MYIVVGKITENRRDKAYAVFGIREKKVCIITRKEVKRMLNADYDFFGMELRVNNNCGYNIHKNRSYYWKRIPEITGKGEPEKEEDKDIKILIGTNGYKEVRHYIVVSPAGKIELLTKEAIKQEIKKDNIIGATYSEDDRILAYINNEISDEWLEELGYEKDEEMMWHKKIEPEIVEI